MIRYKDIEEGLRTGNFTKKNQRTSTDIGISVGNCKIGCTVIVDYIYYDNNEAPSFLVERFIGTNSDYHCVNIRDYHSDKMYKDV